MLLEPVYKRTIHNTMKDRTKGLIGSFFLLMIHISPIKSTTQCFEKSGSSEQFCAELNIYENNTFVTSINSQVITQHRGQYMYVGIQTEDFINIEDCWLSSSSSTTTYLIFDKGCATDTDYGKLLRSPGTTSPLRLYGRFLKILPGSVNSVNLFCNISTQCGIISGCITICDRNPEIFRISSERIDIVGDGSDGIQIVTESTAIDIPIIIIVCVVVFVILILVIIALCFICRSKRRTRSGNPTLVSVTHYENPGFAKREDQNVLPNGDIYATVNLKNKKAAKEDMDESSL